MPVIDAASLLPLLIAIPLIGAILSVLLHTKDAQVLIGLLSALGLVFVIGLSWPIFPLESPSSRPL